MLLSFIVPVFNADKYLANCLESLLSQNLTSNDYEIICVNDGSTDYSAEILRKYKERNQEILKVITQENAGVSAARNRGLSEARGEYIWFFDSDDAIDPNSIERAIQIINEQKPDLLMFGMSFDYYAGKRLYQRLELCYEVERLMTLEDVNAVFSDLYYNNMLTPCWNKLFRSDILKKHRVHFSTDMFAMEDFLFSLQAMRYCDSIYTLPQIIYRYNQGNDDETDRVSKRLNRISNLPEYMRPFEMELINHPNILTSMFFMLLRQALSIQTPSEIAETAKTVCNSEYARGKYVVFSSGADQALIQQLKDGRYKELYRKYKKAKARNYFVGNLKRSPLYSLLKESTPKKIKW